MRTTIILPDNKHKKLKSLAFKKNTSVAKLINEALESTYFSSQSSLIPRLTLTKLKGSIQPLSQNIEKEIKALRKEFQNKLMDQ